MRQVETNMALEMNRIRRILSRRKMYGAASRCGRRIDGAIYRGSVERLPIARGSERSYVKNWLTVRVAVGRRGFRQSDRRTTHKSRTGHLQESTPRDFIRAHKS